MSPIVIFMDSPERAFGALLALECNARGAPLEACALLENGASARGPLLDNEVTNEALPA